MAPTRIFEKKYFYLPCVDCSHVLNQVWHIFLNNALEVVHRSCKHKCSQNNYVFVTHCFWPPRAVTGFQALITLLVESSVPTMDRRLRIMHQWITSSYRDILLPPKANHHTPFPHVRVPWRWHLHPSLTETGLKFVVRISVAPSENNSVSRSVLDGTGRDGVCLTAHPRTLLPPPLCHLASQWAPGSVGIGSTSCMGTGAVTCY